MNVVVVVVVGAKYHATIDSPYESLLWPVEYDVVGEIPLIMFEVALRAIVAVIIHLTYHDWEVCEGMVDVGWYVLLL